MTGQKSEAGQITNTYFQSAFAGLDADAPLVQLAIESGYAHFRPLPEEDGIA